MKEQASKDTAQGYLLTVTVPVADLRAKPLERSTGHGYDGLQETQLLLNETLTYRDEEHGGWYFVEAGEQKKLTHGGSWAGYPGWVKKEAVTFIKDPPAANSIVNKTVAVATGPLSTAPGDLYLSAGTRLDLTGEVSNDLIGICLPGGKKGWVQRDNVFGTGAQEEPEEVRERVVATAKSFIGTPYLWGGRSTHIPSFTGATGMDCSGLTNLAYRVSGIDIPRDAHDQWVAARKVPPGELKPADLIFLSLAENRDRVTHVMLFLGKERFIEAVETGLFAEVKTFREKFGLTFKDIVENNSMAGNKRVYCGSFIENRRISARSHRRARTKGV